MSGRARHFSALAVVLAALPLLLAAGDANLCAGVRAASTWGGTGWNHVVYVTNRCNAPISCDVSTNVNASTKHVSVAQNETVEVITATSAVVRAFVPIVHCDGI